MVNVKLSSGQLVGDRWHDKGEVVSLPEKVAERFIKAGAGNPVPAPARIERAVAPRQQSK